jgi:hypothetical protein
MVFIVNRGYILTMTCGGKTLILSVLSSFLLSTGAQAIIPNPSGNPYQGITERNIFGLKPPPAPPGPEETKAPPPKIKLTGITTILGRKQALLLVEVPAKPPQGAREESYILTEGQRDGDIEVLAIDEKAGTVKVDNRGTILTLDFVNNGVKLPSTPGALPPGMIPMPIMNNPGPGVINPGNMPPPPGARQIPTRQLRGLSAPVDSSAATYPGGGPGSGYPGSGYPGSASLGMGTGFNADPRQTVPIPDHSAGMTSEEQAVIVELEKERLQRAGDETFRLMPPTQFSEATQ